VSLSRKTSLASLASRVSASTPRRAGALSPPGASPLGRHSGRGRSGSGTAAGGDGSPRGGGSATHLPLAPVAESASAEAQLAALAGAHSPRTPGTTPADADDEYAALEAEMAEVRRRRAEVTARYQRRLEYLRARLKGAEMHEKLLRK
jgi:hypothetical protein